MRAIAPSQRRHVSPPSWNAARCLERIAREGRGVIVLLSQPETEQHLLASVDVALGGEAATDAAAPEGGPSVLNLVGVGSQILRQLGVGQMRLMGPPMRYNAISGFGLEIVEHVPY